MTILAFVRTEWFSVTGFECQCFVAEYDFKLASLVIQCKKGMQW